MPLKALKSLFSEHPIFPVSHIYIDMRSPYPEEMAMKPYPTNYTPPIFPKYDGMVGNAREHIKRYMDALTAHSYDHELRLMEFSKSLKGRAFTWHTSLLPGSVLSWNDMVTQFLKKFFTLRSLLYQICSRKGKRYLKGCWTTSMGSQTSP